jgi:ABC-2 type transport system permease protein
VRLRNVLAVAQVEFLRLIRSRVTLTLLLVVPLLQVVLFGFAIRPEADSVSIAVAAPNPESASNVVEALREDPRFRLVGNVSSPGGAESAVKQGRALVGIEIPEVRSFANLTAPNLPVRIIVDATNPTLTTAAAARIEARYWRELAERADAGGPGMKIERLHNPAGRADWTFLPALAGVTVMIAMIMLGSLAVSREREGGTWETLQSLPLGGEEVLAGKMLPGTVLGTMQGAIVLAIGTGLFDVPVRGSLLALLTLLPLFAAAHFAIGYAISARAATQLAALQGAVGFYLPAMLLSGFLYPFETLPGWAQIIGNAFPLSHLIRAAQGATLRGDTAATVLAHGWPMLIALLAAALAALLLRSRAE